jgi:hypothetical protein
MLRTVADQPTLWEAILPEELRRLPEGTGTSGCLVGRSGVLYFVRAVFCPEDGSAVDADGNLSAVDVFEVPLSVGFRVVVPGGVGLDHLAAVLPHRAGPAGAAPNNVDEVDHPMRLGGGGGVEQGLLAKAAEAKLLRCTPIRVDCPRTTSYVVLRTT